MRAYSKGVLAEPNSFLVFGLFNDPLSVSWMDEVTNLGPCDVRSKSRGGRHVEDIN